MTLKPYNFRKPDRPAGTLEHRLTAWLRAAGPLAAERGAQHLPFRIEMALRGVESVAPSEALGRLPDAAVGYRVAFAGEAPSMLFVLAAAVGPGPGQRRPGRDAHRAAGRPHLTVVEQSLCEYLMQNLLAAVLQRRGPGRRRWR